MVKHELRIKISFYGNVTRQGRPIVLTDASFTECKSDQPAPSPHDIVSFYVDVSATLYSKACFSPEYAMFRANAQD